MMQDVTTSGFYIVCYASIGLAVQSDLLSKFLGWVSLFVPLESVAGKTTMIMTLLLTLTTHQFTSVE